MKLKYLILTLTLTFAISACKKSDVPKQQNDSSDFAHKVIVEDVLQANSYTYLKVREDDNSYWMAVARREVKKGEALYYDSGLEMKNFESKDLQRTFETVYFVQDIATGPVKTVRARNIKSPHGKKAAAEKKNFSVTPVKGGVTIAEIFANRTSYANKTVKIKGRVTKVNAKIMGRNWVHIQDGTDDSGNYDLTITTKDVVKVGDVVVFSGKITLNRDFGAGYSYDIIMEDAKLEN